MLQKVSKGLFKKKLVSHHLTSDNQSKLSITYYFSQAVQRYADLQFTQLTHLGGLFTTFTTALRVLQSTMRFHLSLPRPTFQVSTNHFTFSCHAQYSRSALIISLFPAAQHSRSAPIISPFPAPPNIPCQHQSFHLSLPRPTFQVSTNHFTFACPTQHSRSAPIISPFPAPPNIPGQHQSFHLSLPHPTFQVSTNHFTFSCHAQYSRSALIISLFPAAQHSRSAPNPIPFM